MWILNQKIGTGFNSTLFNDFFQVNELIGSLDRNFQNTNFCVMINKGIMILTLFHITMKMKVL